MSSLRPAGLLERWSIARHLAGCYRCFSLGLETCVSVALGETKWKTEIFPRALQQLCRRHPMLNTALAGLETDAPYFVPVSRPWESADVQWISCTSACWDTLLGCLQTEVNTSFDVLDTSKPLWRIRVLHTPSLFDQTPGRPASDAPNLAVVVSFFHSIGDGVSAIVALRDLMQAVSEELQMSGPEMPSSAGPIQLPPPLDKLVHLRPSLGLILSKAIPKLLFPVALQEYLHPTNYYVGEGIVTDVERLRAQTAQLQLIRVPPETVSRLTQRCRERGTTVHGALMAACCLATLQTTRAAPAGAADPSPRFFCRISSAVALRTAPHLTDPSSFESSKTVLNAVCGVDVDYHVQDRAATKELFWSLALDGKQQLQAGVPLGKQTIGLLSFLSGTWESFMLEQLTSVPNGKGATCGISNLGQCEALGLAREYGPVRLGALTFCQSNDAVGPLLNISAVTAFGELRLTMASSGLLFPPALAGRWTGEFESLLHAALQ